MKPAYFIPVFLYCLLSSCNLSNKPSKFIGKWHCSAHDQKFLFITKSGQDFILEDPQVFGRSKVKASYNQNKDILEAHTDTGNIEIIYDKNTEHLITTFGEYTKVR